MPKPQSAKRRLMSSGLLRGLAGGAGAVLLCCAPGLARAEPDLTGVWMPPFRIHPSGYPLFGGSTPWIPVSQGDPKDAHILTLDEQSVMVDQSVRNNHGNPELAFKRPPPPPFTEAGAAANAKLDHKALRAMELDCYPSNVMSRIGGGEVQIVQGKSAVAFISEAGLGRTVFLDGRTEKDALPQWSGHSVGRWDGDTLKIVVTAIRGDTWGMAELPMDEQAKVTEEYHLEGGGKTLVLRETFEDPTYYKEPLRRMVYLDRLPAGEEVTDYTCTEGKADMIETVSKPGA